MCARLCCPRERSRVPEQVFDAPAAPGGLEARMQAAAAAAGSVPHVQMHPQVVLALRPLLARVSQASVTSWASAVATAIRGNTWSASKHF